MVKSRPRGEEQVTKLGRVNFNEDGGRVRVTLSYGPSSFHMPDHILSVDYLHDLGTCSLVAERTSVVQSRPRGEGRVTELGIVNFNEDGGRVRVTISPGPSSFTCPIMFCQLIIHTTWGHVHL